MDEDRAEVQTEFNEGRAAWLQQAKAALAAGNRVVAVRYYRMYSSCSLREAVDFCNGVLSGIKQWPDEDSKSAADAHAALVRAMAEAMYERRNQLQAVPLARACPQMADAALKEVTKRYRLKPL